MKKSLLPLFAACALGAANPVFAQDKEKDKGADRQQVRIERLSETLTLSDGQKVQVAAVFEQFRPQVEALRADSTLSREDRAAKMQEIQKATSERITPILTPEQQAKYAEMREKRPGGGPKKDKKDKTKSED